MELITYSVLAAIGAAVGFALAAYIYGKELGREKQRTESQSRYIEHLESQVYNPSGWVSHD